MNAKVSFQRVSLVIGSSLLLFTAGPGVARQAGTTQKLALTPSDVRATLDQYCVTCHNQRLKTANLELDTKDVNRLEGDVVAWEAVVRKLRTGMMPPRNAPRPGRATLDSTAAWLAFVFLYFLFDKAGWPWWLWTLYPAVVTALVLMAGDRQR